MISNVKVNDDGSIKIKTLEGKFVKISHESDLLSRFDEKILTYDNI